MLHLIIKPSHSFSMFSHYENPFKSCLVFFFLKCCAWQLECKMHMVEINRKELPVVRKKGTNCSECSPSSQCPSRASPQALLTSPLLASTCPVLFLDADSQSGTVLWCDGLFYFLVPSTNCSHGGNKVFVCFQCS